MKNTKEDTIYDIKLQKKYDRAILLIQYYVQLMWLIFGAFLLAETVLLGALVQIANNGPKELIFGGSIIGLLLTYPWWASFKYNHALYLLRMSEARTCEPEEGSFFSTGYDLTKGKVLDADQMGEIRIPRMARLMRPANSVTILICIFALAFLFIAIKYRPPFA